MRGRKPKPSRIKLFEGNRGKRPVDSRVEMEPTPGEPPMPAWLSVGAQEKWAEVVPELLRLGVLTILDGAALACYCQSWAEYRAATRTLEKEGRTYKLKNGCRATHPMVAQQKQALKGVREFAALFGLEPSGRARLRITPPAGAADLTEDFFR